MYNNSFKIMLGKWPKNNNGVTEIFNKKKINFLNNISLNILNKKKLNSYPDLKSFAFWCREKNIKLLKKKIFLIIIQLEEELLYIFHPLMSR